MPGEETPKTEPIYNALHTFCEEHDLNYEDACEELNDNIEELLDTGSVTIDVIKLDANAEDETEPEIVSVVVATTITLDTSEKDLTKDAILDDI